ncbi:hypothetical protein G7054_g9573 [Neopestalotiopsis clavispora]|nr:hypothetical protein G7054_g9573 [Neopestalotiopsis clavispora]
MSRLGKDPRVGMRLGTLLRAGGFVDVEETSFELPLCEWPTDPQERQIGAWNKANVDELLYSLALWPMTSRRGLRMPVENFIELVENARVEAGNPAYKVSMLKSPEVQW